MTFRLSLFLSLLFLSAMPASGQRTVIEDFQRYDVGTTPERWHRIEGRGTVAINQSYLRTNEYFKVVNVDGRKALEGFTRGMSHSIVLPNGHGYDWRLSQKPWLSWMWKAQHLPTRAREDEKDKNDVGIAVYVTFDADVLGRPRSIKYTYSSTLPVGTVISFGSRLKAIVVDSGASKMGAWRRVNRNVVADYKQVFGGEPGSDTPLSIMIWSDSDSTGDYAKVFIDDLALNS